MKKFITLSLLGIIFLTGSGCSQQSTSNQPTTPTPTAQQSSPPNTCTDEPEGTPVITSLSATSGSNGTTIEISGCNFSGFEGDKNAWIENDQGTKGLIYGEAGSTANLLRATLKSPLCQQDNSYSGQPCDAPLILVPGSYKIYATAWGKDSNKIDFIIR